ncbi:uncharacterized protein LOC128965139 [Oppia nitens]|uniref:uncharacterized protein LOC128965139 n=1 Tax=Oppia nitens TaxID=1686743 RepID=UPI0023DBB955|nr:uncharacterized protein LOC128965139 [Oppia nitens]
MQLIISTRRFLVKLLITIVILLDTFCYSDDEIGSDYQTISIEDENNNDKIVYEKHVQQYGNQGCDPDRKQYHCPNSIWCCRYNSYGSQHYADNCPDGLHTCIEQCCDKQMHYYCRKSRLNDDNNGYYCKYEGPDTTADPTLTVINSDNEE